jgi:argininosuccinate lyase
MKLWKKEYLLINKSNNSLLERQRIDLVLAKYDAFGLNCPCKIGQIGLLTNAETEIIVTALEEIIIDVEKGNFVIEDSFEDVHSKSNTY